MAETVSMSTPVESTSVTGPREVVVFFKNTGNAPPLTISKIKMRGDDKFARPIAFLRKQLKRETLFLYIDSRFSLIKTWGTCLRILGPVES